ncbi:GH1 family beta-glucosidase [Albirhodobacter sp. R86504]|uniref:GH1 family beta-glucosidase n=1 Tax=Albirhodobacter sp. R86504 TaxID=3093848 RepID=UPI00366F1418
MDISTLPRRSDFPQGFLFGAATSAYQIEGHKYGGAGPTHWDAFAAQEGRVVRGENGAVACDHYHRWPEDLDLLADAGFDIYRFSTSWARIMPEGRIGVAGSCINSEGVAFYDRLIDGMLERGLKPALTLYHWELPQALAEQGGWRNRDIAGRFGDYAEFIATKYGDRLWSTAPINEPWCVGWLSHFDGHHAPGLRDIRATAPAMHHIMLAHGTAIQALRASGMDNLGAVCNFEYAIPADDSEPAQKAAEVYDAIYNRFFLSGLFKGEYPDLVMQGFQDHMPANWEDDFEIIQSPIDWLGLNYYTCKRVKAATMPNDATGKGALIAGDPLWPHYEEAPAQGPLTAMGWEIYPQGLHEFLTRTAREYTGDLPLYVTENGMAAPDQIGSKAAAPAPRGAPNQNFVADSVRIDYFAQHLDACLTAIHAGVPLKGYIAWSLLDNYEWALGYDKRFGLVHVDFETQVRTPKASWHALAEALGC